MTAQPNQSTTKAQTFDAADVQRYAKNAQQRQSLPRVQLSKALASGRGCTEPVAIDST